MSQELESCLLRAVDDGVDKVKELLKNPGCKSILARENLNQSPLVNAVWMASKPIITLLLDAKANANQTDGTGRSALLSAVRREPDFEIIELLLNRKADPNITNEAGAALHHLVFTPKQSCTRLIHLLVDKKADVNLRNKAGRTPLSVAAGSSWPMGSDLTTLLARKADPMIKDNHDQLAIVYAMHRSDVIKVKILAEAHGSDLKELCNGMPPLYFAINGSSLHVVQILLGTGKIDVNGTDTDGCTPLHAAVASIARPEEKGLAYPHRALVQTLLESKANPNIKDKLGRTPFDLLPEPASSEVQRQVGNLLQFRMREIPSLTLFGGLHKRTGARSFLSVVASRSSLYDRQVLRAILKASCGTFGRRPASLPGKTSEERLLQEALQKFSITFPSTLLQSKCKELPWFLIYPTVAEAGQVCPKLGKILDDDPEALKAEPLLMADKEVGVIRISQQDYEKLLMSEPKQTAGLGHS